MQELPSLPDIMNLETANVDLLEQSLSPMPEIQSQLTAECLEMAEVEEMEDVEAE